MILIGLTGSLATGKSTVSRLLSAPPYSLPTIDADLLARQVVEPGTHGYKKILHHFSSTTPDLLLPSSSSSSCSSSATEKGRPINRAALGRRVFGPEAERVRDRKVLNGIIHPLVRLAIARQIIYYHLLGHWACILDIPLLYESALDIFVSIVIMVAVTSPSVQMARLRERDKGLTEQEARDRVGSQMGVREKVERTLARGGRRGKVVWNDGGRGDLEEGVGRVMREVGEEVRLRRWGWAGGSCGRGGGRGGGGRGRGRDCDGGLDENMSLHTNKWKLHSDLQGRSESGFYPSTSSRSMGNDYGGY